MHVNDLGALDMRSNGSIFFVEKNYVSHYIHINNKDSHRLK